MNWRITADNVRVMPGDKVFEIVYRYYNAEISLAEPSGNVCRNVPEKFKVWKHLSNCRMECRRLNQQITKY